jgi:hypothetical protein
VIDVGFLVFALDICQESMAYTLTSIVLDFAVAFDRLLKLPFCQIMDFSVTNLFGIE